MNPGRSSRKIVACYRRKESACNKNAITVRKLKEKGKILHF
jgi:hypothetical protein